MTNWDDPMSEREARVRRRRGSGDLVMARPPTIGAGLNELDNLLSQLDANQAEQTPQQQVRGALGAGITAVLTAALAVFIGLVGMRPTTCEDTCAAAALRHHQRRRRPRRRRLSKPSPSLPPPSLPPSLPPPACRVHCTCTRAHRPTASHAANHRAIRSQVLLGARRAVR
jgi:hypothetical protein